MKFQLHQLIGTLLGGYISVLALIRMRIAGMSPEAFIQSHSGRMLGIFMALTFISTLPHFINRVADIYSDVPARQEKWWSRFIGGVFALVSARLAGMVFAAISLALGFAAWLVFTVALRGSWHFSYFPLAFIAGAVAGYLLVDGIWASAAAFAEMWRRLRANAKK
jgi:hypothetical protein